MLLFLAMLAENSLASEEKKIYAKLLHLAKTIALDTISLSFFTI
jgi:hypothetical protein